MVDLKNINNVILFGPYLHQHPNGLLFYGLFRAFIYKRFKNVLWINQEKINLLNNYNLSNSIFITDDIHDDNIPLRDDCYYLLFNNKKSKYNPYFHLYFNIYSNNLPIYVQPWKNKYYIQYSLEHKEVYFPWATELLPEEILILQEDNTQVETNTFCILGDISNELYGNLKKFIKKYYYNFELVNSYNNKFEKINRQLGICLSTNDEITNDNINHNVMRIISYGGFPISNSELTLNLFDRMCSYYINNNSEKIVTNSINKFHQVFNKYCRWSLMDDVKEHHTFVQRVEILLWMLLRL